MQSLAKDQQCFLVYLLPPALPIPKAIQNDGKNRLANRLAIDEYHMAEQKPKIRVLSRRYSLSHSTLIRYTEVMVAVSINEVD